MLIKTKFKPGKVVITSAAIRKLNADYATAALAQHLKGNWGIVDREDWEANDKALVDGTRLLSVYPLPDDPDNFWIITEHDRSVTTILLPSDY
jgi:hypothetical protein